MSSNWSQGGQNPGPPSQNYNNSSYGSSSIPEDKLPICFNCGVKGHFVKDCSEPTRNLTLSTGNPVARGPPNGNFGGVSGPPQQKQWNNSQDEQNGQYGQQPGGPVHTSYSGPRTAPPTQRYPPPVPQFGIAPPYAPPPQQPPYQQYPQAPPNQSFTPQGPPQQFQPPYPQSQQQHAPPPTAPYQYNQQSRPQYNGPPAPQQQYVSGNQDYQAPNNQYPTPNPQQRGPPAFQRFPPQQFSTPQAAPTFQPQPHNNDFGRGNSFQGPPAPYQQPPPQWNNSQPALAHAPYGGNPSYPQPNTQYHQGFQQNSSVSPTQGPQPMYSQKQGTPHSSEGYRPPSTPAYTGQNQHVPVNTSQGSPNPQYFGPPSNHSRASSIASASFSRRPSKISYSQNPQSNGAGAVTSVRPQNLQGSNGVMMQNGQAPKTIEGDEDFEWTLKAIFPEETVHEFAALAHPLSVSYDMTPVPLLGSKAGESVSRYARRENLKEFTKTIREAPQWPYLQQDPAFKVHELEGESVPLKDIPSWMEAQRGTADVRIDTRKSSGVSRKRKMDERDERNEQIQSEQYEQDDIDYQLQMEVSNIRNKRQKQEEHLSQKQRAVTAFAKEDTSGLARPRTPVVVTGDDVWAPRAEDADPMEALLASLGVSGAPKPVEPHEPVLIPEDLYKGPPYKNENLRQDSGYMSARGSYGGCPPPPPSNFQAAEPSPWDAHLPPAPPTPPRPVPKDEVRDMRGDTIGRIDPSKGQKIDTTNSQKQADSTPEEESPLSPTSKEILGKLNDPEPKKRKIIRTISGRNSRPTRPPPDTHPVYNRRW